MILKIIFQIIQEFVIIQYIFMVIGLEMIKKNLEANIHI
jgi:hypothetical protein